MKLFEIGDGLKSIKVSSNYFAKSENDGTVILYDPEIDFAEIRINVITGEPKDHSDVQIMYRRVIEQAKEKGIKANITNEKSYYYSIEQNQEDDLMICFFKIGYLNHLITISITASIEFCQNNEEKFENIVSDIISFIPSIKEISLQHQNKTYN